MGIHKSLILRSKLVRHRNVLKRDERIVRMLEEEKRKEDDSVFGLPKLRNILHRAKKVKKEAKEAVAAAPGATAEGAPAAAGAKPGAAVPAGAGTKAAAPAADKAAAPKPKR